eukprot:763100-Hanusia_phi.AAC.24
MSSPITSDNRLRTLAVSKILSPVLATEVNCSKGSKLLTTKDCCRTTSAVECINMLHPSESKPDVARYNPYSPGRRPRITVDTAPPHTSAVLSIVNGPNDCSPGQLHRWIS